MTRDTPKERFIEAVTEALSIYQLTPADFDVIIEDGSVVRVGFYDDQGEIWSILNADLSTLTVNEEES